MVCYNHLPSLNEDLHRNARGWCDSNTKELNGFSFLAAGTIADDVAVVEDCIVGVGFDEGPPDSPDLHLHLPPWRDPVITISRHQGLLTTTNTRDENWRSLILYSYGKIADGNSLRLAIEMF